MLRAAVCAAALAAAAIAAAPAQAERLTVSQYGILVPTLPYAVAGRGSDAPRHNLGLLAMLDAT